MASLNKIRRLDAQVSRHQLWAPKSYHKMPLWRLREIYNGIGPGTWSDWCRAKITELLKAFSAAALVHDYEYATSPRTYLAFTIANVRFGYNCCRLAREREAERLAQLHEWAMDIDQRKEAKAAARRMIRAGILLALLCQLGGWRGYKNEPII